MPKGFRKFQGLLLYTFLITPLFAANPKISIESVSKNFGQVVRGQVLEHDFTFTNKGTAPLLIVGTHASCGCTSTIADQNKSYMPGESGVIKVKLETENFSGKIVKTVMVMTNEKMNNTRLLTMNANIFEKILATPPIANLGQISTETGDRKEIALTSATKDAFSIQKIVYDESKLSVLKQKSQDGFKLIVFVRPGAKIGFFKENLTIHTSLSEQRKITVPITAMVFGPIQVSDKRIEFGTLSKNETVKKDLTISSKKDFQIKHSQTKLYVNGKQVLKPEELVQATTIPNSKNKAKVALTLKNNTQHKGNVSGQIKIATDHSKQKEIVVDVHGFLY